MKNLVDALRNVSHPVQKSQLVCCGALVHARYSNTVEDITNSFDGFISFVDAWEILSLKDLRVANEAKVHNTTALLANTSSYCTSPSGCRSS